MFYANILTNVMKREKYEEKKRRKKRANTAKTQNPELSRMQKTKDRERYIRRKQADCIKLIGELSVSAMKRKRKAWSRNLSQISKDCQNRNSCVCRPVNRAFCV